MNILLCLNRQLYRQLFVLLVSIFKNNPAQTICLHIFETDFTENEKAFLREYVKEAGGNVKIYHIFPEMLSTFVKNGRITVECYCRLLAAELLPQNLDRVLYMDVDIVVEKPLDTLYHSDFGNSYLNCHAYTACQTEL